MSANPDQYTMHNPLDQYPIPDFSQQPQAHPGLEAEMQPRPDYGEKTYRGSGRLQGRRAVITGGDSGIGRAVALAFAREGAQVLISYLPNEERDARETVALLQSADTKVSAMVADLQSEDVCHALIEHGMEELGGIDILVNNAAFQMSHKGGIHDISTEEFDRTLKTNLYASFWLAKAAYKRMQPGSSIISSTSIQAYQPEPELLAYAMTKAALVAFTKALALQGIADGIRVNAVAPGPVWTPLIASTMPPEKIKSFGKTESPMGRPAQPAELAPAYVYLASQESSYVTGHILGVTGGNPTN